jgi:hypothetical protein
MDDAAVRRGGSCSLRQKLYSLVLYCFALQEFYSIYSEDEIKVILDSFNGASIIKLSYMFILKVRERSR